MKKYLVCFDLDGTLLNTTSTLNSNTIKNLKQITDLGHTIILATGRSYLGALRYYKQLKLTTPLITDNGNLITYHDKTTKRNLIDIEIMHELFLIIEHDIDSGMFNIDDTIYAYNHSKMLEVKFYGYNYHKLVSRRFDLLEISPSSFIFAVKPKSHLNFINQIDDNFPQLSHHSWGVYDGVNITEVFLKDSSKWSAINHIGTVNYPNQPIICVGDGINDIDMIRFADIGIAMKNGILPLKNVADVITKFDNKHDGATISVLERIL